MNLYKYNTTKIHSIDAFQSFMLKSTTCSKPYKFFLISEKHGFNTLTYLTETFVG